MNNLKGLKCYLAGAIESSKDSESWRNQISTDLKKIGVIPLNPHEQLFSNQIVETPGMNKEMKELMKLGKYDEVSKLMKQVVARDLRACDAADFLIVNLETDVPSWGTPHEIFVSSLQKKPILFRINKKENFPLWLCGIVNHNYVFSDFKEILNYLWALNSSPIDQLDSKYWKIFSPNITG